MRNKSELGMALSIMVAGAACVGERDLVVPETVTTIVGDDRGMGNVIGLELFMQASDYATEARFLERLDASFVEASAHFTDRTVIVLPEYVGAWLVAVDEGDETIYADSTSFAMLPLIAKNLPRFAAHRGDTKMSDADTYAVFATKSARMAEVYQRVMSTLAERHRVTVVGGSILLVDPVAEGGEIVTGDGGPLVNASFVFDDRGALMEPAVIKVFPTESEQGFLSAGAASDLPVFDTPAGRLAVLVCADAWYPESYAALEGRDVDVIAVPVFVDGAGKWDEPWGGYSGHEPPDDVDEDDVGTLTEGEAWAKYALTGRAPAAGVTTGISVPLRGQLWDLETDGAALVVRDGAPHVVEGDDAPRIVVVWR